MFLGTYSYLLVLLLFLLSLSDLDARLIQLVTEEVHHDAAGGDDLRCDGWRLSVETNNAGSWSLVPSECSTFVGDYMKGDHYLFDSMVVADHAVSFAQTIKIASDGMDAWIFDIDETLLSNLPLYQSHGFGSEPVDESQWDAWAELADAPALPASFKLYNEIKQLGFTIMLLTGRSEHQRNLTEKNLLATNYNGWAKLILRGSEDEGKLAIAYKSQKRSTLVDEGYRIHGSCGDQWSDLLGFSVAERSFKLPNPMYYIG